MDRPFDALHDLAQKYRALMQMCVERDAFEAAGVTRLVGEAQRERHQRARALARRFPGCLRELDGATVVGLKARLVEIEGAAELTLWMKIVWEFHEGMRGLLAERVKGAEGRMHDRVFDRLAQKYGMEREIVRAIVHEGRCER